MLIAMTLRSKRRKPKLRNVRKRRRHKKPKRRKSKR
jgi:hypothetical protein